MNRRWRFDNAGSERHHQPREWPSQATGAEAGQVVADGRLTDLQSASRFALAQLAFESKAKGFPDLANGQSPSGHRFKVSGFALQRRVFRFLSMPITVLD